MQTLSSCAENKAGTESNLLSNVYCWEAEKDRPHHHLQYLQPTEAPHGRPTTRQSQLPVYAN